MNIYQEAATLRGFYSTPILHPDSVIPECYDLFEWYDWNKLSTDGVNWYVPKAGKLKEELFDTLEKKIFYLQGCLEENHSRESNSLSFANSNDKVERCKLWINEVARLPILVRVFHQGIKEHHILYAIPICHTLVIDAQVFNYIKNYKSET